MRSRWRLETIGTYRKTSDVSEKRREQFVCGRHDDRMYQTFTGRIRLFFTILRFLPSFYGVFRSANRHRTNNFLSPLDPNCLKSGSAKQFYDIMTTDNGMQPVCSRRHPKSFDHLRSFPIFTGALDPCYLKYSHVAQSHWQVWYMYRGVRNFLS